MYFNQKNKKIEVTFLSDCLLLDSVLQFINMKISQNYVYYIAVPDLLYLNL